MTSLRERSSQTLIVLALFGLLALMACTPTQENALLDTATKVSIEIDDALETAPHLAFVGQVTNPDGGSWLNDYVALVYKDGVEAGRDISQLGEFPESDAGKVDGLFVVEVKNAYDLTAVDLIPAISNQTFQEAQGMVGIKYIYTWLNEVAPGYELRVDVPSKRINYQLIILPVSTHELPADFLDGPTMLTPEKTIVAENGAVVELVTAMPTPNAPSAAPPPAANGIDWNRTITGFSGNRWEAWLQYVDGQVSGIEWEQFKDDVLIYNPDLETDGFIFLAEKQYLLPQN